MITGEIRNKIDAIGDTVLDVRYYQFNNRDATQRN